MFKGRTSVLIIVGIVIVAVLYLLLFRGGARLTAPPKSALPVDLQKIIPTKWTPDPFKACDFDGDGEEEWLITYHYDAGAGTGRSLIGGVIYDAQVNRVPQAPGNESPYQPAFLVPYKLLPDFYMGKGQGYLGETGVKVNLFPPEQNEKACRAQEITVQGFSDNSGRPTRLSIFQWDSQDVGYVGWHFIGNARIEAGDGAVPITQTLTYNRLNDRSALCAVQRYTRPPSSNKDVPPGIRFTEDGDAYTVDFCFGPPDDPTYPEGVVVALLRGSSPKGKDNNPSPTGESFLTADVSLPSELARLRGATPAKLRLLSVTNEGAVAPDPGNGQTCDPAGLAPVTPAAGTPTPTPTIWWCGRERATVVTEIILGGQHRIATWHLLSIANDRVNADVHWRIEQVEIK